MPNFEVRMAVPRGSRRRLLLFLVIGHLFIGLFWEDGVYRIDF